MSYRQKKRVYDYYYQYNLDLIAAFACSQFERFLLPPVNNDANLINLEIEIESTRLTELQTFMQDKLI